MTERLEKIRLELRREKKVLVNDLSKKYGVSTVAIRRDLSVLEQEGIAKRIYGGAILSNVFLMQAPLSFEEDNCMSAIAHKACGEISDGDSLVLGSGVLCCRLAKMLSGFHGLTVVTNNISALPDLISNGIRVFVLGGEVITQEEELLTTLPQTEPSFFENVYTVKAFTGIDGVDLHAGLTVSSSQKAALLTRIPAMTSRWYLMAEHQCFDHVAMFPAARLTDIRHLISDSIPSKYQAVLRKNEIEMHIAHP